jgi:hypothetical protein
MKTTVTSRGQTVVPAQKGISQGLHAKLLKEREQERRRG